MYRANKWIFVLLLVFGLNILPIISGCQNIYPVSGYTNEQLVEELQTNKTDLELKESDYALAMRNYYMGKSTKKDLQKIVADIDNLQQKISKQEEYLQKYAELLVNPISR
ncbi:MAG: hypothetical protein ACOX7H_06350 [Bacillota bacterium]|jgi:type I restriction-modification system DNA methylase subunit